MTFDNIGNLASFVSTFENTMIGVTSGVFDLIHPLHVDYLNKCKRECDILIVLIDSDKLVFKNKTKVPVIDEFYRTYMIDNVKSVDLTLIINSVNDIEVCLQKMVGMKNQTSSIVMFKRNETIYNTEVIRVDGIEISIIPDITRFHSTSEIQNYLKQRV